MRRLCEESVVFDQYLFVFRDELTRWKIHVFVICSIARPSVVRVTRQLPTGTCS
jgi:hypothetical protein